MHALGQLQPVNLPVVLVVETAGLQTRLCMMKLPRPFILMRSTLQMHAINPASSCMPSCINFKVVCRCPACFHAHQPNADTVPMPAGIGLEIASQLLHLGDSVVLCSRSIERLKDEDSSIRGFVDAGKAFLVSADLSTVRHTIKFQCYPLPVASVSLEST